MSEIEGTRVLLKLGGLHRVLDVPREATDGCLKLVFCDKAKRQMKKLAAQGCYYVDHAAKVQVLIEHFYAGGTIDAFVLDEQFDTPALVIRSPLKSRAGIVSICEVVEALILPTKFGGVVANFHVRPIGSYPPKLRKKINRSIRCWLTNSEPSKRSRAQMFATLAED